MKDLKIYLTEGKQIDDKLASEIVKKVLNDTKLDIKEINKEMSTYDYDMDIILKQINAPSKKSKVDNISILINSIWDYLEDNYKNESSDYYSYIVNNLDKII